jgi:hypothetical protein
MRIYRDMICPYIIYNLDFLSENLLLKHMCILINCL